MSTIDNKFMPGGFPSPAEPWREQPLDLRDLLIPHPEATFFLRMQGPAMRDAGISDRDILIIDRTFLPVQGSIVTIVLNRKLLVRRIFFTPNGIALRSGHVRYPAFRVQPSMQYELWGVVIYAIHPLADQAVFTRGISCRPIL
ncbi:MAG TPA: S24 family peptidase [Ktedonobacteraceae bacterium]|nr:S24 family peptidase [Ktedonobacteraceae bacterium]